MLRKTRPFLSVGMQITVTLAIFSRLSGVFLMQMSLAFDIFIEHRLEILWVSRDLGD